MNVGVYFSCKGKTTMVVYMCNPAWAGFLSKKTGTKKEPIRIEQLRLNHTIMINRRQKALDAIKIIEKLILKLECQIEEQEWIIKNGNGK